MILPNVVVLTATVTPNVTDNLKLSDPRDRLGQYQEAIASWARTVKNTTFSLAVVETSGATRDDLLALVPQAEAALIRFESFSPNETEVRRGKGAIEFSAISHILNRLALRDESTLIKVTGRLTLGNPEHVVVPLDANSAAIRMTLDRTFADTRVISATFSVWRDELLSRIYLLNDDCGIFAERYVAGQLAAADAQRRIRVTSFSERPLVLGSSGTTGKRYGAAGPLRSKSVARLVEAFLRRLAAKKQV